MHYIFDLDGTLLDSYPGILKTLGKIVSELDAPISMESIHKTIIEKSVRDFMVELHQIYHYEENKLWELYNKYRLENEMNCTLMPEAKELLDSLISRGDTCYIYTHKEKSTFEILEKLGIKNYFTCVLTKENGFQKKPNPEGVLYLLDTYNIKKEEACYVGDRPLDIECAHNAGILGVLYLPKSSPLSPMPGVKTIHSLMELLLV